MLIMIPASNLILGVLQKCSFLLRDQNDFNLVGRVAVFGR